MTWDKREFLRPCPLTDDHFAEAGETGVLKRGVVGQYTDEKEDAVVERSVDSPTKVLSAAIIPGYSKPDVSPNPTGFQGSLKCVGEPIADEDTDAPDSDDAERTGGCSWNECDVE
jgi:hypothetical protein